MIVQPLVDDHIEKAHRQSAVRPRPELEPFLCARGKPGQSRINADDLGALFHQVNDPVPKDVVWAGSRDIVAPNDDALGYLVLGGVVTLWEPLRRIQDAIVSLHGLYGRDSRAITGDTAQREHDVGAAICVGEHAYPGADVPAGPHGKDHTLGPELFPDFAHSFLNEIKGLVPGDLLPFAFPALSHSLKGAGQAVGMVSILGHRQTSGAETPLVPGMIGIAFDLDQFTILDVRQYPTAAVTARAGRPGSGAHDLAVFTFHHSSSIASAYAPSSTRVYGSSPPLSIYG